MKVLFVHAVRDGLMAEYAVHTTLAAAAADRGVESHFLWQAPTDTATLPAALRSSVTPHDFGHRKSDIPRPSRGRRARMVLGQVPSTVAVVGATIRRIRPDVVYSSQQQYDALVANLAARKYGLPHVLHLHYSVGPWLGSGTLRTIKRSQHLLAVSEFVRQTAMLRGVDGSCVTAVPNPVPGADEGSDAQFSEGSPALDPAGDLRAELHIPADAPVILSVGRLDPAKGHMKLLDAFAVLHERMPAARLIVCGRNTFGDGHDHDLKRRAVELGIDSHVIFAGHRDDVPALMQMADVFCLATEMEPFGLVFVEAMAAGLPVVACHSGAVPEIVLHQQTGLLSPPNDADGLATNLQRVLTDPVLARRLGDAGRERASTEFTPSVVVGDWIDAIGRAVDA